MSTAPVQGVISQFLRMNSKDVAKVGTSPRLLVRGPEGEMGLGCHIPSAPFTRDRNIPKLQPHSQLPTQSITPQNTSALLAFASIGEGSNGAMSQPRISKCAGMLQPCSSSSINPQGSFQGIRSHKELCRFTGAEALPCCFSLPRAVHVLCSILPSPVFNRCPLS